MKSFPVFKSIEIDGYGLYPGPQNAETGLHATFHPGLTLIVGANGLGKTTLITLIFRMLTGPSDIPQLGVGDELGFRRLAATTLQAHETTIFAKRVADRAATAIASLSVSIGSVPFKVERRLSNLSLVRAQVGDTETDDELQFQQLVVAAAGVGSFGDFILMLRYLIFYFEDRRALVWDPSAQRQLLRMLFLPPDIAQSWTEKERSILKNDSQMRNFQAVVGREEKLLNKNLSKNSNGVALRAELQALESLQESSQNRLTELQRSTEALDDRRQQARLMSLQTKQERESRFRALEHAKLLAIETRFPGKLETGRYMLAHLMSEHDCLVCGSHAPGAAKAYAARLEAGHCVVCDSDLTKSQQIVESRDVADRRVARSQAAFEAVDKELETTNRELEATERAYDAHAREISEIHAILAKGSARLAEVVELLPESEAVLRKQRTELSAIRSRLEAMKTDLATERAQFRGFVEKCTSALLASSKEIVAAFEQFAGSFLSEKISLTWTSRSTRIGQGGEAIPFPVFELNMTGSDFSSTVRRAGPEDVSESQREFIDLAFRMALMRSAGQGPSSLVVDTPESSLDAVFAKRAAQVLLRFGDAAGNTVIVTSNLIEGNLLITLVEGLAATSEKEERLVDLFGIARPTAAVVADQKEYDDVRNKLFAPLS